MFFFVCFFLFCFRCGFYCNSEETEICGEKNESKPKTKKWQKQNSSQDARSFNKVVLLRETRASHHCSKVEKWAERELNTPIVCVRRVCFFFVRFWGSTSQHGRQRNDNKQGVWFAIWTVPLFSLRNLKYWTSIETFEHNVLSLLQWILGTYIRVFAAEDRTAVSQCTQEATNSRAVPRKGVWLCCFVVWQTNYDFHCPTHHACTHSIRMSSKRCLALKSWKKVRCLHPNTEKKQKQKQKQKQNETKRNNNNKQNKKRKKKINNKTIQQIIHRHERLQETAR